MRPLAAKHISSLTPYVPGKPVEELERELGIKGSVKLASNENPLGPSPRAVEAVSGMLDGLNRYPDGAGYYLKKALSERLGHPPEGIVLGNGSNELLELAVRTFMTSGDEAVMAENSFVVYALATKSAGCRAVTVPLSDGRHDLMSMANAVTDDTRLVFIANPNNPTGTMNTAAEMDEFLAAVPAEVIVVVDEAYYEYAKGPDYPDCLSHARDGRRLIVMRTFSKAYGLAGLRIGYALAGPEMAGLMNRVRQPFNTGSLSQAAALAALGDEEHVARSVELNERGKSYLYAELDRLGVRYYPTSANFIYMMPGRDSGELYKKMLGMGVIVRPVGPCELRVTIGLPEENARFIKALEAALS